jgi:hypothetical protein
MISFFPGYRLRTTDYGLRTTDYGLRTTDYGLRTTDYGLRTTDYGLRTTDYGFPDSRLPIPLVEGLGAGKLTTDDPGCGELGMCFSLFLRVLCVLRGNKIWGKGERVPTSPIPPFPVSGFPGYRLRTTDYGLRLVGFSGY